MELKRRLGAYSTFIIKQNVNYYPMKVLHAIMAAWCGSRPAGNWVVMTATIGGVDLYVMAYAIGLQKAYLSRYEDEYGIVQQKELPRPAVAHFLYDFLPLIDEHNKARQSELALEKKWLTKCSWTRILTTLLGMAIVDLQRWDRRKQHHNNLRAVDFAPMDKEAGDNDEILVDDFDIRRLCNLISKPLCSGAF